MMSIIGREKQVDAAVKTLEEIGSLFAGVLCGQPGFGTNALQDSREIAALVEQVKIGHRAVAQPCNGVHGLTADYHDAQIEDAIIVARFGYPLLDMHALTTERINHLRDLPLRFQLADTTRIVQPYLTCGSSRGGGQPRSA